MTVATEHRRALLDVIDGKTTAMFRAHAIAIHDELFERGHEVGRLKVQLEAAENRITIAEQSREQASNESNKLVAQIVAEEARAVRAELSLQKAIAVLRAVVVNDHTTENRERARKFLESVGVVAP